MLTSERRDWKVLMERKQSVKCNETTIIPLIEVETKGSENESKICLNRFVSENKWRAKEQVI